MQIPPGRPRNLHFHNIPGVAAAGRSPIPFSMKHCLTAQDIQGKHWQTGQSLAREPALCRSPQIEGKVQQSPLKEHLLEGGPLR